MKFSYLLRRFRAYAGRGILVQQQVIIDRGQDVEACIPIFIIGTHRSGTSLLRRVLDSHSAIACPPETLFIEGYLKLYENYLDGFRGVGFQGDMLRKVICNQASYFHKSYMIAKSKKRWADKTPQYWMRYVQLVERQHLLHYAIKSNSYELRLSVWKEWMTLCFATNHVHYARYGTYYTNLLEEIETTHPG